MGACIGKGSPASGDKPDEHVSQGVQGGGLPDKDSMNSLVQDSNSAVRDVVAGCSTETSKFPFAGVFTGVAYNCQSLYAYEKTDTINAVARIAALNDFTLLSETRETQERKATLDHRLLASHMYFLHLLMPTKGKSEYC